MSVFTESPVTKARRACRAPAKKPQGQKRAARRASPLNILLVEDNPGDAMLTRLALEECDIETRVTEEITDGAKAVAFLKTLGGRAGAPLPDVLLLDIGLPDTNGFEVLTAINEDRMLRKLPVVILTGFGHYAYLKNAYKGLYVAAYLKKPCRPGQLQEALFAVLSRRYGRG